MVPFSLLFVTSLIQGVQCLSSGKASHNNNNPPNNNPKHKVPRPATPTSSFVATITTTTSPVHELILTRHGDSVWNGGQPGMLETFTGWTDVTLSDKGIQEAKDLGTQVATYSYGIDACFTSVLQRAQLTAHHCLWAFDSQPHTLAPQRYVVDYRLNERHYGQLQGMVKQHAEQNGIYDPRDVQAWRRSWHAVPPLLQDDDPRRVEELRKYLHYCGGSPEAVPRGESLAMVAQNRIRPFIEQVLTPVLNEASVNGSGATGLIVAHANSLRALIGVLCHVEDDPASLQRLEAIKIPTGVPLVLRYRPCPKRPGRYQVCDIPGLDHTSSAKRPLPHLPLWPLSAIPRVRTPSSILVPDMDASVNDAAVIGEKPRNLLSSGAATSGTVRTL